MRNSPDAYMIIDGMWGSCGKGLIAGKLALDRSPDVVVCQYAPNAGHTFKLHRDSPADMVQAIPTGYVSPGLEHLLLGPGAIINPEMLLSELAARPGHLQAKLRIHPHAAVVTPGDIAIEKIHLKAIGSTMKGSAAAFLRKVQRGTAKDEGMPAVAKDSPLLQPYTVSVDEYDDIVHNARLIQVESSQGVELSLSRGHFWPYVTGRDITPESTLNDTGVPHRFLRETVVAIRPYPIRVGHVVENGVEVGNSGPVYGGMAEIDWAQVAARAGGPADYKEITTVTKRVRRVFEFSKLQMAHALRITGPSSVFLNFAEYLYDAWNVQNHKDLSVDGKLHLTRIANVIEDGDSSIRWLGWGPSYDDVETVNL